MKSIQDVRMNGAGNRFFIHFGDCSPEKLLRSLHGADGLLIVREDDVADASMRIINADGSEAEQCGNGLRCVVLHLVRSQVVTKHELTIRTLAGTSQCVVHEEHNEVDVSLCVPRIETHVSPDFSEMVFVNMGNPNAVLWTNQDPVLVRSRVGEDISNNPLFAEGMNVNIARRDGKKYATCASYERGVGPTNASGTGGASVFVAARTEGPFFVSSVGGTLSFKYDAHGLVVMTGPANYE